MFVAKILILSYIKVQLVHNISFLFGLELASLYCCRKMAKGPGIPALARQRSLMDPASVSWRSLMEWHQLISRLYLETMTFILKGRFKKEPFINLFFCNFNNFSDKFSKRKKKCKRDNVFQSFLLWARKLDKILPSYNISFKVSLNFQSRAIAKVHSEKLY